MKCSVKSNAVYNVRKISERKTQNLNDVAINISTRKLYSCSLFQGIIIKYDTCS